MSWTEEKESAGSQKPKSEKYLAASCSRGSPLPFPQDIRKQIYPILYYSAVDFQGLQKKIRDTPAFD